MYQRFLCDSDYLSILTKEALDQLIRDIPERLSQAEEVSEASIIEYLHGKFEVENALEVGKIIKEYNPQITYPAGAHFLINDKPARALKTINGNKRPTENEYWQKIDDDLELMTPEEESELEKSIWDSFVPEDLDDVFAHHHHHRSSIIDRLPDLDSPEKPKAFKYSQRKDYFIGMFVKFAGFCYKCVCENGPSFNDIQIPSISCWTKLDVDEWVIMYDYPVNSVVKYEGKFYALLSKEGYDTAENPKVAPESIWGLIGNYSDKESYQFSENEWVVFNDGVWIPTMDPNASVLEESVNYAFHDPRNINLKKYLLRMSVYELHKLISPHNVSTARITDYEAALQWLQDASRMKIDPGIRRCVDMENKKPVSDYGLATFRRDYDPYHNEWQI